MLSDHLFAFLPTTKEHSLVTDLKSHMTEVQASATHLSDLLFNLCELLCLPSTTP